MSPLPSHFELRQRKAIEKAEEERRREKARTEERGLREALARYWELLGEFLVRAEELGLHPSIHQASGSSRVDWVEGYRLRSGSIVTAPPLRYGIKERRHVGRPRPLTLALEEVTLFVVSTDAGLVASLSDPKTESQGGWPAVTRWDRAANLLIALEAELEASLLELMDGETPEAPGR